MNKSIIICLFILIAMDIETVFCQNTGSVFDYVLHYDSLYGMDPNLVNGIKYFPEHSLARGFPFWKADKAMAADIVLSGIHYKNLKIKYNIYNQNFILEYSDQFGALQQLIINRLKIDSVFMNNGLFIRNKFDEIGEYFIQVIHEGKVSCYHSLKKEYRFNNSGIFTGHEYSKEIIYQFIVMKGSVFATNSNSSFLKIFTPDKRKTIRKYMKGNRINVRRKKQSDMINLCEFCSKMDSE